MYFTISKPAFFPCLSNSWCLFKFVSNHVLNDALSVVLSGIKGLSNWYLVC